MSENIDAGTPVEVTIRPISGWTVVATGAAIAAGWGVIGIGVGFLLGENSRKKIERANREEMEQELMELRKDLEKERRHNRTGSSGFGGPPPGGFGGTP